MRKGSSGWRRGMFMRAPALAVLTFAWLAVSALNVHAATGNEAMDWVQKMSSAMQDLSYRGRFIYLHNGQLESMSITHVRDGKNTRERLISLNGEAREILRDNANLTCVWPSSRQVVVDPAGRANKSPLWIPDDVRRLGKFYDFRLLGRDRIAEHPARIVAILPRDEYRYGIKIWIQEQNGLLLQSTVFDEQGAPSEQIMFTELALMHYDDAASFNVLPEIAQGYALIRSHTGGSGQQPGDRRWQLESIPRGFHIETSFQKLMPETQNPIQQMVLSDGLASVSIFIEKLEDQSLLGESSMGAVNAYSTEHRGFSVTAIGEVPAVTVRHLAEAVVFKP